MNKIPEKLPSCYRCGEQPCVCRDGITLYHGDARDILPLLEPGSVDLVLTDPPYGLEFMGKEWDKLTRDCMTPASKKDKEWNETHSIKDKPGTNSGMPRRMRDRPDIGGSLKHASAMQSWFQEMFTAILPACKSGAMLASFGGTRTFHRLTCGIEDAGWEIRDCLMYLYGSGFPKSHDVSKALDAKACREQLKAELGRPPTKDEFKAAWKVFREVVGPSQYAKRGAISADNSNEGWKRPSHLEHIERINTAPATPAAKEWEGYGTALKPAWEPIVLAMKPLDGTFAQNAIEHGVAGINVDGGRVDGPMGRNWTECVGQGNTEGADGTRAYGKGVGGKITPPHPSGRWPANLILSHHPECVQVGVKKVKGSGDPERFQKTSGGFSKEYGNQLAGSYADADGLETVEAWTCHPDCPVGMLDEQSGECTSGSGNKSHPASTRYGGNALLPSKTTGDGKHWAGDTGTASRFFYCAKASGKDRGNLPAEELPLFGIDEPEFRNAHPTVKPLELMRYLLTLLYPPNPDAVCLDPFAGSGTTGLAAKQMGRKCILIELEETYCEIAARRLESNG